MLDAGENSYVLPGLANALAHAVARARARKMERAASS